MKLTETYKQQEVHSAWEVAYRQDPRQHHLNERLMDRILETIRPSQDSLFLDAGCGTGNHTFRILARGFRCVAVDISQHAQQKTARRLHELGLEGKARLACHALEDLGFRDGVFDVVHCRGVLMHIPDWAEALSSLCRVVKPGGHIVVLEANHRSVETALVRAVRRLRSNRSVVKDTPGGLEFWSEQNGHPFVARVANQAYLRATLAENGIRVIRRFATEFWDANRFPAGLARTAVTQFNRFWFASRLPASLAVDNAIVGVKSRD